MAVRQGGGQAQLDTAVAEAQVLARQVQEALVTTELRESANVGELGWWVLLAQQWAVSTSTSMMVTVLANGGTIRVCCIPTDTVLQFKRKVVLAAYAQTIDVARWVSASTYGNYSIRIGSRFLPHDKCELSACGVQNGSVLYLEIQPSMFTDQCQLRAARYH